ncbi:hypothetical protein TWF703_003250 [Orbilia oligospora]|uniref:Uncharacterized protein n=1 Tax=Orbilia oligospora TaxID=2813651 RepID=A0A7C8NJ69_ORBOL|nr:hypothetical protein TWF703_003250 [Orbilia oligospora]
MEIQHPPPPLPSISALPSLSSPRFTPIAIAPKPSSSSSSSSSTSSTSSKLLTIPPTTMTTTTTATTIPKTPPRELWTEPEKYDLLWSIILSTGLTATTIPWHKISLPRNHTQPSAQVVIQDIALGKHHITHPTFTPSNKAGVIMVASRDLQYTHHYHYHHNNDNNNDGVNNKRLEAGVRWSSKKRKLDDDNGSGGGEEKKVDYDDKKEVKREEEEKEKVPISRDFEDTHHHQHSSSLSSSSLSPPNSSISSPSSPISNPDHHHQPPTTIAPTTTTAVPTTTTTKPKPRRRRSTSPPINLDLSNPRITSYLKSSGYMNEDGTPVKKRRGRPTKDPFGLSVTLKKQLMRMDPNAPPMKKRGRPRKRFLDIDSGGNNSIIRKTYSDGGGDGSMGRDDGSISPGLREAIEKIGEEMVEELLVQGRSMRDTDEDEDGDDEEDVESEGYDGEVSGVWEGDETGDEEEGDVRQKKVEDTATDGGDKPERMAIDKGDEAGSSPVKAEESLLNKGGSLPTRKVEKMAVGNLVE